MGDKITLKIDAREVRGKKVRRLRRQGLTPGVVYGQSMEPLAVQAEAAEVRRVVAAAGKHSPVSLTGVKRHIAMIKDVEYDLTKSGRIRHIAFHAVNADEPVHAVVPIHLVGIGESEAEKAGLVVLQALDKIEVKALPMDLPEALEAKISDLKAVGDRVIIGDIQLPDGVTIVEHEDTTKDSDDDDERPSINDLVVANVYEPSALAAANEAAAGDAVDESAVAAESESDEKSESTDSSKPVSE